MRTNVLYFGDNLKVLATLPAESIDLIYADPPFGSGVKFSRRDYRVSDAYKDSWNSLDAYIDWMKVRIEACYAVLKTTGSIYLHCNFYANYRLRALLNEIFGTKYFQNEIIWNTLGGSSKTRFRRAHDTILFYVKSKQYTFNVDAVRMAYSPGLLASAKKDAEGRAYYYGGHRNRSTTNGRVYLHPDGQLPWDRWADLPASIPPSSRDYTGYAGQKPLPLLERIVKASSNLGDIVLDPFCGTGTALIAADRFGREWIGIDDSFEACRITSQRLNIKSSEIISVA